MSNFVVNSDNTKAVRKADIVTMSIGQHDAAGAWNLYLYGQDFHTPFLFEADPTLTGIQAKAAIILDALEAA